MIKPYWSILTKKLIEKGTITTGLTIPYLFGAYRILGYEVNNIRDLLNHISDSHATDFPVIEKCDKILHDVIILEARNISNRDRKKEFQEFNEQTGNKMFVSYNTNLGNSIEKVCAELSARYGDLIKEEKFSWNQAAEKWNKFQPEEIAFIESIK